jgi:hypothetical protein
MSQVPVATTLHSRAPSLPAVKPRVGILLFALLVFSSLVALTASLWAVAAVTAAAAIRQCLVMRGADRGRG